MAKQAEKKETQKVFVTSGGIFGMEGTELPKNESAELPPHKAKNLCAAGRLVLVNNDGAYTDVQGNKVDQDGKPAEQVAQKVKSKT